VNNLTFQTMPHCTLLPRFFSFCSPLTIGQYGSSSRVPGEMKLYICVDLARKYVFCLMIPYVNHEACVSSQHCVCALLAFVSPPATSKSCVVRNLAPEATLTLRLRLELRIHITHVNIMEPILFWYNKLDCIFWLYSFVYIDTLHKK
jgi:hypothetical protein